MRRIVFLALVAVGILGSACFAQTAVVPRVFENQPTLFLYDNETGTQTARLSMVFDRNIVIEKKDVIVFGGGEVTLLSISNTFVFIQATVCPGGTLQLILDLAHEGNVGATLVGKAYWYE